MFYYTYVLLSKKDSKYYVGWSNDLQDRLKKHLEGKVASTKYRRPLTLVYYEACLSKDAAIRREKYFKTGFGRRYLNSRLSTGSRGGRVGG